MTGEIKGPRPEEIGLVDTEANVIDFSMLPSSQYDEVQDLYRRMTGFGSTRLNSEQFEQRIKDAAWLIGELSGIKALETKGREQSARNVRISLENFVIEEVVEHGTDAKELKEQLLAEYEKVFDRHGVVVNINYKSLEGVLKDGRLKGYESIDSQRREGVNMAGKESRYGKKRVERDRDLGHSQPFVVGALSTENGYDEIIGPAPFYGHGVIHLEQSHIADRVRYFEGDSMTNQKTASIVVPRWLLRKWEDIDSRKLDEQGAILSKAIMELYARNRGYTHIHLTYVEAHIFGEVDTQDFKSISYAIGLDEEKKKFYQSEIEKRPETDENRVIFTMQLEILERKERERMLSLEKMNEQLKGAGRRLAIEIKRFNKVVKPKEDRFRPGAQKAALTSDQLF